MDVKSRKAAQAAATRAALMRTARKLFAERGYAATPTEEVVRRARVTRGALYHHFKSGKQELFEAVFHAEEQKLAALAAQAAAECGGGAWRQLAAGCDAVLDACVDPAVQQIVLLDAPSVLGWEQWREIDASYFLQVIRAGLEGAIAAGEIAPQPVVAATHVIFGALNEAAMLIAHSSDPAQARREVSGVIASVMAGLRAGNSPP
jgi:AcrR family transcriptional regulator